MDNGISWRAAGVVSCISCTLSYFIVCSAWNINSLHDFHIFKLKLCSRAATHFQTKKKQQNKKRNLINKHTRKLLGRVCLGIISCFPDYECISNCLSVITTHR